MPEQITRNVLTFETIVHIRITAPTQEVVDAIMGMLDDPDIEASIAKVHTPSLNPAFDGAIDLEVEPKYLDRVNAVLDEIPELTKAAPTGSYETLRQQFVDMPSTWLPDLIRAAVESAHERKVFIKGGASVFVKAVEKSIGRNG